MLEFTLDQKQELIDYLKKTESIWANVIRDMNQDPSEPVPYRIFPNAIMDRYVPDYNRISKQLEQIIELEQFNKPGALPWSQIRMIDLFQLMVNTFWGILGDILTFNWSWDMFLKDNRLLAITLAFLLIFIISP